MADPVLNPQEKIQQYRKAAEEAERNAEQAKEPHVRDAYFAIMRTWIYLAEELEREMAVANRTVGEDREDVFVPPQQQDATQKWR
jgi:hypothetical protein